MLLHLWTGIHVRLLGSASVSDENKSKTFVTVSLIADIDPGSLTCILFHKCTNIFWYTGKSLLSGA